MDQDLTSRGSVPSASAGIDRRRERLRNRYLSGAGLQAIARASNVVR
jgi:hypothetical protein